ncbi:MAG TPA: hypothetical protein VGL08_01805 [Paraburkholderia sp.]
MTKPAKVIPTTSPVRQSDYSVMQKTRAAALGKADDEREQKRRESDARINVNASKWRYVCSSS